ncbi:MAG TPA: MFS transporter [Nakamurella sp.]
MSQSRPAPPAAPPVAASVPSPNASTNAPDGRARRRAMLSSYLGTTVEYYDFLLYGTAASLVFPALFFSELSPMAATIASFGTLAVGYLARPIGGVIFGHFGDKFGRKNILIITLLIMGGVSFLIGLLPTQETIGMAAPILLVTLRIIQGFAVGGEWAGAALMSMEHAAPKGRGFAASIVASGGPSGAVLATLVLTAFSVLPEEQFLAWGWRVPFLLSAILVVIAFFMRLRVTESPEFVAALEKQKAQRAAGNATGPKPKAPLFTVLKHYPRQTLEAVVGGLAPLFMQSLLATFMLTYAVQAGHGRTSALILVTVANAIHILTIPAFAALSDRVGRKPVMVAGAIVGAVLVFPIFALVGQGSWAALLLAFVLGNPIVQALMYGPMGAWMSEKFPADSRYTGVALSYQVSSTLGAGLAPLVATALLASTGGTSIVPIAILFIVLCAVSGITFLCSKETAGVELELTSRH